MQMRIELGSRSAAASRRPCATLRNSQRGSAACVACACRPEHESYRLVSPMAFVSGMAVALGTVTASLSLALAPPAFADPSPTTEVAVQSYQDLESKGKLKSQKTLDEIRIKFGFKRTTDGRVMLRSKKGEWFNIRLDLEVPGTMLLRDSKGMIYAMQTEGLKQVDLSDDYVVLMMFADGQWEESKLPLMYVDEKGAEQGLQMDEQDFRQVVGILNQLTGGDDDDDN